MSRGPTALCRLGSGPQEQRAWLRSWLPCDPTLSPGVDSQGPGTHRVLGVCVLQGAGGVRSKPQFLRVPGGSL